MNSHSTIFRLLAFYGNKMPHRGHWRILKLLRQITGADIDEDIPVVRRDRHWVLNPSDFVQQDVFWTGYKDYWDIWHLERLLPEDAVIVDAGANFGYYAIELALALGPRASVIAFEPFLANFQRLEHHIALNGLGTQIQPLQLGLSNKAQTSAMNLRAGATNSGSAQICSDGEPIELVSLDTLWPTLDYDRLDMMKIDVEGHEVSLLDGGDQVIRRYRPHLLIELDPPRLRENGASPGQLLQRLRSLGYRLFETDRSQLHPLNDSNRQRMHNILCIHEARA